MKRVLQAPGAPALFILSCIARLPTGALGLLLVLYTQDLTGSYARGGLASGAYALALGVSNPMLARFVDRRGQTLVLRAGGALCTAAVLGIALLPARAPLAAILALAALAGLSQPPVGACLRALWRVMLEDPAGRHAAYALEAAVVEFVYICGPLAIVAGVGSWSLRAALLVCAGFVLGGDLAFSLHPLSRGWRPHPERPHGVTGALHGQGVRILVAVFVSCGLAAGAVEVGVPAALDAMGSRDLTGLLLAAWGVGSMLAGFAVARARVADDPPRRLAFLVAAWGVAHAALGAAGTPLELALLLVVAGATIAPTFVCANAMLDVLAPHGTITEAATWITTGLIVGAAVGSALAGALVEAASPGVALATLGGGGVVAAFLVRATSSRSLRPADAAVAG